MAKRNAVWIIILFVAISCNKQESLNPKTESKAFEIIIPKGFPEIEFPEDNEFTEVRWKLGKALFYEKALSRDGTISCASCHIPNLAFCDTARTSLGVDGLLGSRNAPTLANVAYHPYFTREGGVPSLEMQILVPVQEHVEFDHNLIDIAHDLHENENYMKLSQEAYNRDIDPYVITRAIATFERSLISGNSDFDDFFYSGNSEALTANQKQGYELFMSEKTSCNHCHSGFDFSNYSFENNGLYEEYTDVGRFRLTNNLEDLARFKVPTLRNIALTAPYMHDGSLKSLEEIINHYNTGGENHPNKSPLIRPLNLSNQEKNSLIAFLESLSDESFNNNPNFDQ